jgi:hypothetical protein
MASDQQKREYIRDHLDSDLHFLLEDAGVALTGLYAIAQLYRTVKHFSALGDDRAEVRKARKDDFGIDPAAGAVERVRKGILSNAGGMMLPNNNLIDPEKK